MSESSTDREIAAMESIAESFKDLDRGSCARILDWATSRFVREPLSDLDPAFMRQFTDGLAAAAREIGAITPAEILRGAAALKESAGAK